jgi:hypothetical protein
MEEERKLKYEEILTLLQNAELAARNNQWGTCYTASKSAAELALKWHKEWRKEKPNELS